MEYMRKAKQASAFLNCRVSVVLRRQTRGLLFVDSESKTSRELGLSHSDAVRVNLEILAEDCLFLLTQAMVIHIVAELKWALLTRLWWLIH
jgi:hypothetical protein